MSTHWNKRSTNTPPAGPRSPRGPAGLALFAGVVAMGGFAVVTLLENAPATVSFHPPSFQAAGTARPVPAAASVRFAADERALDADTDSDAGLAALAEAIRREDDPTRREARVVSFLARLEAEGFPAAMSRLSRLVSGPLGDQLGARLMRRWAEDDLATAARWAAASSDGALRLISLEQAALVWAGRDWSRASEWARSLPVERERDEALRLVAHETVRSEPVAALAMAVELPAGEPRDQLVLRAASEWAMTDPKGAVAWAHEIADPVLRESVLAGVAVAWGEGDPVAAATLAAEELAPGRVRSDAVVAIVQRWGRADPQAAARWVAEFPEGAMREAALDNLARLWSGELRDGGS